jgi:hypothetical protein
MPPPGKSGVARYRALLLGNALFERGGDALPTLHGPPEDLKLMAHALTAEGAGLHAPADVRTKLDGTSSEVREQIEEFFQSGRPDEQLLLYYSGHGWRDGLGNFYLCTRDTRIDFIDSSALSDLVVNQMIAKSRAARTVIILDCCHSGGFKGGGMPESLAQAAGRFILSSCRARELASDASKAGGASLFTSHIVQALLSGEVDGNRDGFVTLTEVYHTVLGRLRHVSRQTPQLSLDKVIGDVPLGRAVDVPLVPPNPVSPPEAQVRPVLGVSETNVELKPVRLGERISPVIIDVHNDGGGELDWTATTEDSWIEIEPAKKFFKLKFKPTEPGTHQGNVYVRDAGRGGSKRISVFFEVLQPAARPELQVETQVLDFGRLRVGMTPVPQVIRLTNRGTGELNARAQSTNPALRVTANDEAVAVEPDLSRAASLAGEIVIGSAGGRAVVKVTGVVEAGPVLGIRPGKSLDFGRINPTERRSLELEIVNEGSGQLTWDARTEGIFFGIERSNDGRRMRVTVGGNPPGDYLGSIFIKSNGGEATVNVQVQVAGAPAPVPPPLPPQPLPPLDIAGWWQNPNGRIFVSGHAPLYQFADYNAFGVQIGSGTINLNGGHIFMQGVSLFIPYTAQLFVNGPVMSGTVSCLGAQNPVVYSRC